MNYLKNGVTESCVDKNPSLNEIVNGVPFSKKYFYIVHLLDRVLFGEQNQRIQELLTAAILQDEILELHIFNEEKEFFVARNDDGLVAYEPLVHGTFNCKSKNKRVITRNYVIEKANQEKANQEKKYKRLVVKEYVDYDEENHLAYVEKTALYKLEGDEYGNK
ncbi:hypothetical protein BHF68_05985 [Desulfuribacillus alkaliarsenatis]|uniref:Uncharacterized protein n=2 Tax=Desulfuribacillus alkaliarsenatis TaxID=766136 RepID=A0A1E5G2H5_9FIRM|nr:hypothetical protein BHF68_05985 [Desulfuribacillus alkaliarsenatis]